MTRQARTAENSCYLYVRYGNTGCGVFKRGIQNWKDFLPKNQHTERKLLSFENWINEKVSKSAKIK